MRAYRFSAVAAALALVGSLLAGSVSASEAWTLTPGGWVSGPVEYVKTVEFPETTGSGLKRHGRYLYVTTFRSFSIYDVRDALNPKLLSHRPLGLAEYNEQPDTNGKILLLTRDGTAGLIGRVPEFPEPVPGGAVRDVVDPALEIWDVRDKANPTRRAILRLPKTDHMWTCVLDCAYAYGARGTIVSLADPSKPTIVGDWANDLKLVQSGFDANGKRVRFHAIEEVASGLVMTGNYPRSFLLDARTSPATPTVLAHVDVPDLQYPQFGLPQPFPRIPAPPAYVQWPEEATSRYLLLSMESPFSSDCTATSGGFSTWDTTNWVTDDDAKRRPLRKVDDYRMTTPTGLPTEGRSPYHVVGCSSYNFDAAEDYAQTGRVAVSWFEDGVRLLSVDAAGEIRELGGFLPLAGEATSVIWRNDDVLYSIDINRGLDILRVRSDD